jgi:hypothetical protein
LRDCGLTVNTEDDHPRGGQGEREGIPVEIHKLVDAKTMLNLLSITLGEDNLVFDTGQLQPFPAGLRL